MATLGRVAMNKARHKQGWFAEQNKISKEKRKQQEKQTINKEEHNKRLEKLKKIGLIK